MFISGVNDTGDKLFGGVNDNADKIIANFRKNLKRSQCDTQLLMCPGDTDL
jgi:hypothetical protein